MNFSTARSERITAIISTVVAVVILAAGVTAHQSHNAPVDEVVQLESDLRFQLEVGFRHDPNERATRLNQLEEVTAVWQQSPRSAADQDLLASWLLEATIRSMPGSIESLPVTPKFGPQQPVRSAEPTPDVLVVSAESADFSEQPGLVPTPAKLISMEVDQPATVDSAFVMVAAPRSEFLAERAGANSLLVAEGRKGEAAAEPVEINLTKLAARIAGYHDGLDEVETALLTFDSNDLPALDRQLRQLDEMTRDFQFVRLYTEALTNRERQSMAEPRSMSATLSEIERRLDRNQEAVDEDFLGEFDAEHLQQMTELRQLLSDVASRIER